MPRRDNFFRRMAREHTPDLSIIDDMVQEARIAYWQAESRFPGRPESYYTGAVRNRMIECATRGT